MWREVGMNKEKGLFGYALLVHDLRKMQKIVDKVRFKALEDMEKRCNERRK